VELRLRNAWRAGAVTVTGQVLHAARHSVTVRDTITAAADAIGWATRRAEPAGVNDKVVGRLSADRTLGQPGPADAGPPAGAFGRTRRGIGLATAHHGLGGPAVIGTDTATAFVKANPDGTVTLLTGAADVGQGIDTALSQIVGEELRIPADAISIAVKVTDGVPDDQGASASRTLYSVGNATRTAAVNLRDKLLALAAEMLEADRQDLEWGEGTIAVRGTPARTLTMTEVVRQSMLRRGEQPIGLGVHHGHGVALDEQGHGELQSFEYSTQAAEVEVDLDTGEVRVLRLVNAQEVGRAINPLIVEGQVEGGMVMGLGFALLEEVVCRDGQVLNPYAFDYRVPRAEDMPEITTVLLEHRDPVGPYGAKGCGEICMDPTAAAIANAVSNAIGARVTSLPITPEKVLRAIREAAEARAREAQAPR